MAIIKYFSAYLFLAFGYISLVAMDWMAFSLLLFSFILIPLLELVTPENKSSNVVKNELAYDLVLYSLIPAYFGLLVFFLSSIGQETNTAILIGKISAMGLLCGIFGINLAHELGHRQSKIDQFLAKLLLCSSQYMHFFVEHNRGHHKRVGTFDDPATARKGEHIYRFWFRTVTQSYVSAWGLENDRLKRKKMRVLSLHNSLVVFSLLQISSVLSVGLIFGWRTCGYYLIASFVGILLLETINYIEHYGLVRKKISESAYESVDDVHSWNSDYILGRSLLFELTRHSHHHANSTVKYPTLESRETASQLPAGYPGMMLLSLVPFLWFKVMDKRLD